MIIRQTDKLQDEPNSTEVIPLRHQRYIQPFWQERVTNGFFVGQNNVQIAYAYVVHPKAIGSVAISSGRIETLLKYKELVFNLYNAGYSVFIHDHRGQGLSGRMTENTQQGYVDDFADYVADFKRFYDKVIAPYSRHQPMLISHSMGAAIAGLYLLAHPNDFAKCVMSAPMFGIRPALPRWLAYPLLGLHRTIKRFSGPQPHYFFNQQDYRELPFEHNVLTHSQARYQIFRQEYQSSPQCQLGGVTADWLWQALRAMSKLHQQAHNIRTPILILQAGQDQVVNNRKQDKWMSRLPNCQLEQYEGAYHELFMEVDSVRDPCLRRALDFIADPQRQITQTEVKPKVVESLVLSV